MKRLVAAAIIACAMSAPAFAQASQTQPATPDNGVGVDYTQPHLNDLLLRVQPRQDGMQIRRGNPPGPGAKPPVYRPGDPDQPPVELRRLPPVTPHPNAQD